MNEDFLGFAKRLESRHGFHANPTRVELQSIGEELKQLCLNFYFKRRGLPEAERGQEMLYELAVSPIGGPSVYLVSDGPGVKSPPHEHQTWAVIVGVRGCELNLLFKNTVNKWRQSVSQDA